METALFGLLIILLYGNPVLLLCAWILRLKRGKSTAEKWRTAMLWLSLTFATVAVLVFWGTYMIAPSFYPQRDNVISMGRLVSRLVAAAALVSAILGEGRERKWVAASALIVPLNWAVASAFE